MNLILTIVSKRISSKIKSF